MIHAPGLAWRYKSEKGPVCLRACNFFPALSVKVAFINIVLFISLEHQKLQQHCITNSRLKKWCMQSEVTENPLLL